MNSIKPTCKGRILFFVAVDYYFYTHRLKLACSLLEQGYEVSLVTQVCKHRDLIESHGIKIYPIMMSRSSLNPFSELFLLRELLTIFKIVHPDIVHNVAMKPILYGTLLGCIFFRKCKVINTFAGLGTLYLSSTTKVKIIRQGIIRIFKWLFRNKRVYLTFQNKDDLGLVGQYNGYSRCFLVPGSGVNIEYYTPQNDPQSPFTVLFASRMLRDKGIFEFIRAAEIIKARGLQVRFLLAGDIDEANPSSLTEALLKRWQKEGVVDWLGQVSDIRSAFEQSHVVVLPSYREGLPKVLLEASACQKAIITTDAPGCRELIQNEVNGLLVPVKQSEPIADAIERLFHDEELRRRLAYRAREVVCESFSDRRVLDATLEVYAVATP